MPRNIDNENKNKRGREVKDQTLTIINNCEVVESVEKGKDLSKIKIEKAKYDTLINLKNHQIPILVTTTSSLRDDRMDTINSQHRRAKKILSEQNKKAICMLVSTCDSERSPGDDHKLFNAYNFENREEIGIDLVVKQQDLKEVLQTIYKTENDDRDEMIIASLDLIKKKNY